MTDAPLFPTQELRAAIEEASGLGLTAEEIADCFSKPLVGAKLTPEEVREHFAVEIARGRPKTKLVVARSLLQLAETARNEKVRLEACEFFLDRLGGPRWQEHSTMDIDVAHTIIPGARDILAAKIAKYTNARTIEAEPAEKPPEGKHITLPVPGNGV